MLMKLCKGGKNMSNNKNDIQNITSQVSLSPARDTVYEFNQAYQRASNTVHIFDDGTKMTTVEAHTLKHICQNEGCTITDLVNYWGRTKGTISAQITNLENKGYLYREKCKNNAKKVHIFPTELGLKVNERHNRFDVKEIKEFVEKWNEKYTIEDLHKFLEYMEFCIEIAYKEHK